MGNESGYVSVYTGTLEAKTVVLGPGTTGTGRGSTEYTAPIKFHQGI
jgi:hypothetical protein